MYSELAAGYTRTCTYAYVRSFAFPPFWMERELKWNAYSFGSSVITFKWRRQQAASHLHGMIDIGRTD